MDWYPWCPADHREDTMHLTAEQDGMYRRLLDHYMETRQPLPDSPHAWARIAGVSIETMTNALSMLQAFFKQSRSSAWHHKRCDSELQAQDTRSKRMTERAKKAATKRWENQPDTCNKHAASNAKPMLADATRTKTKTSKKEKPSVKRKKIPVEDVTVELVSQWAQEKIRPEISLERELIKFQNHDWKREVPEDGVKAFQKWLINAVGYWEERNKPELAWKDRPGNRMPSPAGG